MRKTFKYRIYPTRKQRKNLEHILEECRWVYNKTLEIRKNTYESEKKLLSLYDTNKLLTQWKADKHSLQSVHSQILQETQQRVDLAFKAFFRRVKKGEKPGYPRFKGFGRYDSFTFPQSGFSIQENRIKISKIGLVKTIFHRPIEGKIKRLTIRRKPSGKWFACFSCETIPNPLPVSDKVIGIDLGITNFAVFSNGEKIKNPRFLKQESKNLAQVQRRFSKTKSKKDKHSVAIVYERLCNKRKDFSHKLSRKIVDKHGIICFEDLNIKRMVESGFLAKSIYDVAWNQLVTFTSQKAECAARSIVLVDPRNTTKMCSKCGTLVEKDLSCRIHHCSSCGLKLDRDLNAAINILRVGLHSLELVPRSCSL